MELIKATNLELSSEQLAVITPYLIVALGGMLTLLTSVMKSISAKLATFCVTIATLLAAMVATQHVWGEPSMAVFNNMLLVDYYSTLFNMVFLGATLLVALSAYSYLEKDGLHYPEFYSLMLFACLGMMLLVGSLDLIVMFVALEIMSIAVYVLVGFRRIDTRSNEAAMKYFILGSLASAVFLFGVHFFTEALAV